MTALAAAARPPAPVTTILPGLALAAAVALAARAIAGRLPPEVGEIAVAILLGLVVGTVLPRSDALAPGLRVAVARVLRIGVVLLGARLSLATVAAHGLGGVLLVVVVVSLALTVGLVAGRLAGLPEPLALLIAVGTAICGNSAILATAPVVRAEQRHVSIAVATITTFGLLAVILYPVIGRALGLDDATYGRWAGLAVNDTSQVVAASLAFSQPAGDVAIVVKLVRNLAIAPVLVGVAWAWSRRAQEQDGAASVRVRDALPLFVLGFLGVAALSTVGWLDASLGGRSLAEWATDLARVLILVAVAAIGLGTRPDTFLRGGARPFLLGLACALVVSASALALVIATARPG